MIADGARRVLQVHTRYRRAGGEDQVVEAERRLLEGAGLDVQQVIFDNSELQESASWAGNMTLAFSTIWSRRAHARVRAAIRAQRPDVVHVHNTFPAASPSVCAAAGSEGVPVVQTLHNYRFVCPAATLFRDGHTCIDCVGRRIPWPGVLHACYHDSRVQTAVVSTMIAAHRLLGTYERNVRTYIALTEFQRQTLVDGGLPASRVRVISNFLEPDPGPGDRSRSGILWLGRLTEEKGVPALLSAAPLAPGLVRVAGDGPLVGDVRQAGDAGHLEYLGTLERASVFDELRSSIALALTSTWFEGFPLVVLEAYATGTPVIATRIGSLAEIVEDGVTGLLVTPGEVVGLADRLRWAADHPEEMHQMGANGRRRYETRFRGESHLVALQDAYQALSAEDGRVARA